MDFPELSNNLLTGDEKPTGQDLESTDFSENVQQSGRNKDVNRQKNKRKKRESDAGPQMKERNERRKLCQRPVSGNIRFYTDTDEKKLELFNMLDKVKLTLAEKVSEVSNYQAVHAVLSTYLADHQEPPNEDISDTTLPPTHLYQYCTEQQANEDIFLVTESAIKALSGKIHNHFSKCEKKLDIHSVIRHSHVAKVTFNCSDKHSFSWDTSPHIERGWYLVNARMCHAYLSSGLRKIQYNRFCNHAHIGQIPDSSVDKLFDIHTESLTEVAEASMQVAIGEEEALSLWQAEQNGTEYGGIDIVTDARHQWRKNAACSDVIALGDKTKKCVRAETITHNDDTCSQRHEMVGTKKLYEYLDENHIAVNIHAHDRNETINKFLTENYPGVKNANDTWHLTKGISKEVSGITKGPKKKHGQTWHEQLSDKGAAIKTHCYWAIKTCEGSEAKLRSSLENIVQHYKDIHTQCHPDSPCRSEPDYQPSKIKITEPVAEELLLTTVKKLKLYKRPTNYLLCRDTHYVESFNNSLLIYHDKRIVFRPKEYRRRTLLSVLDWNEHIDRQPTSLSVWEDVKCARRRKGKRNLPPKSYNFVDDIWKIFLHKLYN